jgi:hypothetical protein
VLDYLLDILFGKLRGLAFQFDLAWSYHTPLLNVK